MNKNLKSVLALILVIIASVVLILLLGHLGVLATLLAVAWYHGLDFVPEKIKNITAKVFVIILIGYFIWALSVYAIAFQDLKLPTIIVIGG